MDIKDELAGLFRDAIREKIPEASDVEVTFERPRDPSHGDLATNIAMQIAKKLKRKPRALPRMEINPDIRSLFDFAYEDFKLVGYDPHPAINAQVAV